MSRAAAPRSPSWLTTAALVPVVRARAECGLYELAGRTGVECERAWIRSSHARESGEGQQVRDSGWFGLVMV